MRRIFLFGAAALSLLLVSCSPSIEGTWIQPETSYTQEQGFVLYKGGVAEDINIDFDDGPTLQTKRESDTKKIKEKRNK